MLSKLWTLIVIMIPLVLIEAQDLEPKDSLTQDLIITHARTPISIKSGFKPTIIIKREKIESQATDDLSILLDQQVGLNVISALSNPAKDKSIFLQGASGEFTLILIDGVPLTDPSGIGGTFDIRSISLSQIERIEILKGGQSTLYGSDAIAGVINLITKTEYRDKLHGNLRASLGSYSTQNASANIAFPVSSDINIAVDASISSSDGISEALDENNQGFDEDGFDRRSFSAHVDWKPSERFSFKPFIRASTFDGDFDGGAFTDGTDQYDTDWLQTGLSGAYKTKKSTVNGSYTYNRTNRTFDTSFGVSDFQGRFRNLDLYGHTSLNNYIDITIGINHQSLGTIEDDPSIDNADANIFSPYASLAFHPSLKTNAEIGLRWNRHSDFGSNVNYSLGASNWINDNVKIYGYWATSFKAPNLFQLFGQFGANPELNPQNGRSLNLGLSFNDVGIFKLVDISVFDRNVDDLIIFDFNDGFQNLPSQHDQGLELSLQSQLSKLDIGLSYEYLFGELDNLSGSDPVENLIRRPKHRVDASFLYKYFNQNYVSFTLKYAGDREDAFFNTTTFETNMVTLDSYWIGDLYAEYSLKSPALTFYGSIRNIFDTEFQEVAGFTTLGRNINFGIRLSF